MAWFKLRSILGFSRLSLLSPMSSLHILIRMLSIFDSLNWRHYLHVFLVTSPSLASSRSSNPQYNAQRALYLLQDRHEHVHCCRQLHLPLRWSINRCPPLCSTSPLIRNTAYGIAISIFVIAGVINDYVATTCIYVRLSETLTAWARELGC